MRSEPDGHEVDSDFPHIAINDGSEERNLDSA
jgi:hypothetical protein